MEQHLASRKYHSLWYGFGASNDERLCNLLSIRYVLIAYSGRSKAEDGWRKDALYRFLYHRDLADFLATVPIRKHCLFTSQELYAFALDIITQWIESWIDDAVPEGCLTDESITGRMIEELPRLLDGESLWVSLDDKSGEGAEADAEEIPFRLIVASDAEAQQGWIKLVAKSTA